MSGPLIAGFLRVGASPRINVLTRLGNAIDIVGPRPTGGSLRIAERWKHRASSVFLEKLRNALARWNGHLHDIFLGTRMSLYRDMLS